MPIRCRSSGAQPASNRCSNTSKCVTASTTTIAEAMTGSQRFFKTMPTTARTIAAALATTRKVLVPLPTKQQTPATTDIVGVKRCSEGISTSAASNAHAASDVATSQKILDGGGSQVTRTIAVTGLPSTTKSTRLAGKITRSTSGLARTSSRGVGSIQCVR